MVGQQDEISKNKILREMYLKELRTQKLYTQYHVNPLRKVHTITKKPMSWHDAQEEATDDMFLEAIHAAQQTRKKYEETQTESQEIGWHPKPLSFFCHRPSSPSGHQPEACGCASQINPNRDDRRLNHFRVFQDITLYKAKMWSLGETDVRSRSK